MRRPAGDTYDIYVTRKQKKAKSVRSGKMAETDKEREMRVRKPFETNNKSGSNRQTLYWNHSTSTWRCIDPDRVQGYEKINSTRWTVETVQM